MDFYDVLNISRDAETAEIEKAFRAMSLKHHPDKANPATVPSNGETPSERQAREQRNHERFVEITTARDTLVDPAKRQEYDRKLRHTSSPSSGREEETRDHYAYNGTPGTSSQYAGHSTNSRYTRDPRSQRNAYERAPPSGYTYVRPSGTSYDGRAGPSRQPTNGSRHTRDYSHGTSHRETRREESYRETKKQEAKSSRPSTSFKEPNRREGHASGRASTARAEEPVKDEFPRRPYIINNDRRSDTKTTREGRTIKRESTKQAKSHAPGTNAYYSTKDIDELTNRLRNRLSKGYPDHETGA